MKLLKTLMNLTIGEFLSLVGLLGIAAILFGAFMNPVKTFSDLFLK